MKHFLAVFSAFLIMFSGFSQTLDSVAEAPEKTGNTITVVGVGDIMLGTNYPSTRYLPPNNACLLEPVDSILKGADVTMGNLEGTILTSGGHAKGCRDPKKCYVFRMPDSYVKCLSASGFDFLSLANNHSGDMGAPGRENTKKLLGEEGIQYAGLLSCPTAYYWKDSILYGFCAFAPNRGTCDIRNIATAKEIVKEVADSADVVIVSFHGGAEGKNHQHVTKKTEYYLGENRGNVYAFSHAMIDAGADIVFGHGPHVTRAIEVYNDRFIAYSLGNFCTYHRFNLLGPNGMAPIIRLKLNDDGSFISGEIIPIIQIGEGGPIIDQSGKVIRKIKELNRVDFPNSSLVIEENGKFYLKK